MPQNSVKEQLIAEFTESYMEKLFYFCLKKTGEVREAEDLTQDIALNVITALHGGTVPTDFGAWVWQIARNRYCTWAKDKRARREFLSGTDIEEYEIEDEQASVTDEMIQGELMALLRRELAFIRSDYRNIVVAYYIENRSMRDIAASLSLQLETVKKRLQRARKILKEGMDMAREFGIRSYKPEQISFVKNGHDGKEGQPWSIIKHLLYKNIFLETYENPETAEELALELGIALPYMEDELEFLVREELLRKEGDRYQTNFEIISREQQRAVHEANLAVQGELTQKLCEMLDLYMAEDGAKVNASYVGDENAKWALLMRLFDWMKFAAEEQRGEPYEESYPARPGDGAWTLTGFETIDWEKPHFVGQHGWISHDESEIKQNIDFGQFKFYYQGVYDLTPDQLSYPEAYNLWVVCAGKREACERSYVDRLLEYGYLKTVDGVLTPNVLVLDRNAEKPYNAELTERLGVLKQEILALFDKAPAIERGYVLETALANGWLRYDENTIKTVGAYIYL